MREVVAPTVEPLTLEEVRIHLRQMGDPVPANVPAFIDAAADDSWVTAKITAARQWAEEFLGFPLSDATYEEVYSAFPATLPADVGTVVSIQYLDIANVLQTLAGAAYTYDTYSWTLAPVTTWPVISKQTSPIRLRFKGTYTDTTVPQNVKHALLLLIGHWYENREATLIGKAGSELPMGVDSLLRPLRTRLGMA